VLLEGAGVFLKDDGEAVAATTAFGPDDDPDELFEKEFGSPGRYLAYGFNAPGYNDWR
jgi:hypothetical protein